MIKYTELRDIQKKERNHRELSDVSSTFYDDCREFISKTTEDYKKTVDPMTRRLLSNSMDIIQEINNCRYEKILHAAAQGKPIQTRIACEKDLYENLRETFTDYKRNIHNPQEIKEIGE